MSNTKELTDEAIRLMQLLGFSPEVVTTYSLNGDVLMSGEGNAPIPLDDATRAEVLDFEKAHNAVVYHVVYSNLENVGPNKSLLCLRRDSESDFPIYETAARRGSVYAYVVNMLYPQDSDSGFVTIRHNPYPVRIS